MAKHCCMGSWQKYDLQEKLAEEKAATEAERVAKEAERAAKEAERAAKKRAMNLIVWECRRLVGAGEKSM